MAASVFKNVKRIALGISLIFSGFSAYSQYNWTKLSNAPYNGAKQDDVFFINPDTGWAVNGSGKIHRTNDGGNTWKLQLNKPGTFFRCIGFINDLVGFAGNIGTDYFPGVTDTIPLYKTTDGGNSWTPVSNYTGPSVKGLCAIQIVKTPFINSGVLDYKVSIYAGGRVGSPAFLMKSTDNGTTWTSIDMSNYCSMITDIQFISADTGFVFGGSNSDIANSNAKILYTTNGGNSFSTVYNSTRVYEIIWKATFANAKIGYATVLSYDPNNLNRYVAKTTDGGLNWVELPLTNTGKKEFGIGFINENIGWVGTDGTGFETTDGGKNWTNRTLGSYANKIRVVKKGNSATAYAIGLDVYKLVVPNVSIRRAERQVSYTIYPNPNINNELFVSLQTKEHKNISFQLFDAKGTKQHIKFDLLENQVEYKIVLDGVKDGAYILQMQLDNAIYTEQIMVGAVKP